MSAGVQLPYSVLRAAADQKIALLGAMQSLFEGSMYTFVFLWTPALSPHGEHLPHGMIFACFMVSQSFLAHSLCTAKYLGGQGRAWLLTCSL